jgi:ribosomal protein L11 methyltransferase
MKKLGQVAPAWWGASLSPAAETHVNVICALLAPSPILPAMPAVSDSAQPSLRMQLEAPSTYVATIEVLREVAETIAAALEGTEIPAAMAVTLFKRGEGVIEVSAHYAEEPALEQLLALIGAAIGASDVGDLRVERLLPEDWVARAESMRAPVRAGRFIVHGHHDRGTVPRSRNAIEIDAGLAFGTAHHATTRGCLIALDRIIKRKRPRRVLDIGTGTGILAIAAARVLNVPVRASDIDPIATATAAANAQMNAVGAKVQAFTGAGLSHPRLRRASVDLLFANILLNPLLALAPAFARAVRPGGLCVLSGLLDAQARQVEARFRALGFHLDSRILLEGWTTLLLRRGSRRRLRRD